jgi:hypothetical protein
MFLDGPNGRARDAVHVVFAREKVRPEYSQPAPDVTEAEQAPSFRLVGLEGLVRMKLTSFRDRDRVHLRDLVDVGLVDAAWLARLPAELAPRLREILDSPEG